MQGLGGELSPVIYMTGGFCTKLLVYDFVGRGPNEIPRGFFRRLNSLIEDRERGLQRIQKSVVLSAGENLDDLKNLVKHYGGSCRIFRVIEER
jgi:hypothetical protein